MSVRVLDKANQRYQDIMMAVQSFQREMEENPLEIVRYNSSVEGGITKDEFINNYQSAVLCHRDICSLLSIINNEVFTLSLHKGEYSGEKRGVDVQFTRSVISSFSHLLSQLGLLKQILVPIKLHVEEVLRYYHSIQFVLLSSRWLEE